MTPELPKSLERRRYTVLTFILATALFIVTTVLVFSQYTAAWDKSLFFAINDAFGNSPTTVAFEYISEYGREAFWVVLILSLWFFGKTNGKRTAFLLSIAFLVLIAAGEVAKLALYRPRPFDVFPQDVVLVPKEYDSSFPSGHALIVAAGAMMSWFTLRKSLAIVCTIDATLVSFSRIYVGVHFPTDVIGGVFFGIAVFSLVLVFARDIEHLFSIIERRWQSIFVQRKKRLVENKDKLNVKEEDPNGSRPRT